MDINECFYNSAEFKLEEAKYEYRQNMLLLFSNKSQNKIGNQLVSISNPLMNKEKRKKVKKR